MTSVLHEPWFFWAAGVGLGLPLALLVLTELHQALLRRDSALARPVALVRTYLLPLAALLILLVKAGDISPEVTGVRIVATLLGFAVLLLVLSGFNATLFQNAPEGSWRRRMPAIFLEVARFVLIAVGVALILSYIWGANVGGLFTALGITSIVLGLTLQNSVGQIISGLLVLFEQPFQLGDWIDTTSGRGRVIEVNWRATHIRAGTGVLVIPNSVLAAASFTNLSRPPAEHSISVSTVFGLGDAPDRVCRLLNRVGDGLPQRRAGAAVSSVPTSANEYSTSIPLRSPADDFAARTTFLRWLWYAARREGLHLDRYTDDFATPDRIDEALDMLAPILRLGADDRHELRGHIRLTRYGADEILQSPGQVPDHLTCLMTGQVQVSALGADGEPVPVRTLTTGGYLGETTLTRESVVTTARAVVETAVVEVDRNYLIALVHRKPLLLQEISRAIEEQRDGLQRALASTES